MEINIVIAGSPEQLVRFIAGLADRGNARGEDLQFTLGEDLIKRVAEDIHQAIRDSYPEGQSHN